MIFLQHNVIIKLSLTVDINTLIVLMNIFYIHLPNLVQCNCSPFPSEINGGQYSSLLMFTLPLGNKSSKIMIRRFIFF